MSSQDQARRNSLRDMIEKMDAQHGEVFRRLAQGEPEESKQDKISDEETQAAIDRVI